MPARSTLRMPCSNPKSDLIQIVTQEAIALLALAFIGSAVAQPFVTGQGVGPLGTFRTTDRDGPYNITLLSTQANEVAAGKHLPPNFALVKILTFEYHKRKSSRSQKCEGR
jgi:hypothetical protein